MQRLLQQLAITDCNTVHDCCLQAVEACTEELKNLKAEHLRRKVWTNIYNESTLLLQSNNKKRNHCNDHNENFKRLEKLPQRQSKELHCDPRLLSYGPHMCFCLMTMVADLVSTQPLHAQNAHQPHNRQMTDPITTD